MLSLSVISGSYLLPIFSVKKFKVRKFSPNFFCCDKKIFISSEKIDFFLISDSNHFSVFSPMFNHIFPINLQMTSEIGLSEMLAARQRTAPYLHITPIMTSEKIDNLFCDGAHLLFKCEHLQKTGSFKARGALNSAILAKEMGAKGVVSVSEK